MTAYEKVLLARSKERPGIREYIDLLFDDFIELKGDRMSREDSSILAGVAYFHSVPVTIIGHRKGRTTEENIKYNFGMPSPEGYRKALRLMEQAEKFKRPIITFIDTPGAYPGIEAESHGQSIAIATSIAKMSALKTPIISIVTGEGSSGGALAIGVADKIWMLENSIYTILSPEGFASILWKDAKLAPKASEMMKITAGDLKEMGLIDEVIPEGKKSIRILEEMLLQELNSLLKIKPQALVQKRYEKYRHIEGAYSPYKEKA
ncbi:MAG: acetyl-CoA carboxylase carboxyltransferase subunit alpha [Lachnospiraceae bacterium]|nr:acetyl-CoA carboxylase carboxyltransferase subunit alpha [Lachnospiraceae bacterium]